MGRARRGDKPELGKLISTAKMRYHKVGPRKVRDVADLIRGLTVTKAFEQLSVLHRPSSAPMLTNLLKSAVSNALAGELEIEPGELIVGTIFVNGGPMHKRFQPMGHGRAGRIRKRTSHITIHLYGPPQAA